MKRIMLTAVLLLSWAAMGQKSSLQVTLTGMESGTRMVVNVLHGGRLQPADTLITDDKGTIKWKDNSGEVAFLVITPEGKRAPMIHCMLHPREKVGMTAEYDKDKNFLHLTSVKGSDDMEVYRQYNDFCYKMAKGEVSETQMPATMEALVRDNKDKLMSAFLATYFEQAFDQYALLFMEVRDALKGRYAGHEFVRHLDDKLGNAVLVGMEAPEIALPDTSGVHQMRLSDLRGKVVLIDFWASWCRPCRMENPNVTRLYQKYHDMGFEIFSVSLDKDRDRWLEAIENDKLVWPYHVSDLTGWNSAGGKRYGINSIPATVLVDREGKVLARNLRGSQLENKLKEIFGQ